MKVRDKMMNITKIKKFLYHHKPLKILSFISIYPGKKFMLIKY